MFKIVNFVLFQATWFALVLSAAASRPWLGVLAFAVQLLVHLRMCARPARELLMVGYVAAFGTLLDQPQVALGVQNFSAEGAGLRIGLVPIWITALWASFALTLNASMVWMANRYGVAAVLGAVFGPLAYFGAESLGAVVIGDDSMSRWLAAVALGVEWAIAMPVALWLRARAIGANSRSFASAVER